MKRKPFPYQQDTAEEFDDYKKTPHLREFRIYTYFALDEISGLIKIGMSKDPANRLSSLSSSGSRKMRLLLLLGGGSLSGPITTTSKTFVYAVNISCRTKTSWGKLSACAVSPIPAPIVTRWKLDLCLTTQEDN